MSRFLAALWISVPILSACANGGDPPGTGEPQIQFQTPSDGATVATAVQLSATGTGIVRVEFALDQAVVETRTVAPFAWTFDPDQHAEGAHELRVTAFYEGGSQGTTITVTVSRTPPPPPGGPTLDPGFNTPTNVIRVNHDPSRSDAENGDALEAAIESLQANDRLIIGGGRYEMDSRLSIDAAGTEQEPISIEAADGEHVHIDRPSASENIVDIDYARYLTISGIEFSGGSLGIRFIDTAYVFFHANEVHGCDTAIAANSANTHHLYFVDNHVHHTHGYGEGFYLGANDAVVITHDTYVVGNYVHDTGGGDGDGIELKTGSYGCVISDNLVENPNYPGVLVYGNGGRPELNIIERNVIVGSHEGGIQVAAEAIVRNNLIIGGADACIVSQPHQGSTPRNLQIIHNTLVNTGVCFRPSSWNLGGLVFANNALYSSSGTEIVGSTGTAAADGNVILGSLGAFEGLTLDGNLRDATPAAGSPLLGAGDAGYVVTDDLTGEIRVGSLESGAVDVR